MKPHQKTSTIAQPQQQIAWQLCKLGGLTLIPVVTSRTNSVEIREDRWHIFQPTRHVLYPFLLALLMAMITMTARAETATTAMTAAAADTASTAIGLASGLTELNPLGLAGTILSKVVTIAVIDQLPEEDRAQPYSLVSAFWGGAAASNMCWLTGAGPLCFALGIGAGSYLWNKGEEDRSYWADCKTKRTNHPETPCSLPNLKLNVNAESALAQAP